MAVLPPVRHDLADAAPQMEPDFGDMQDFELTVQVGDRTSHEGEPITLDGNEGVFHAGVAQVEIRCRDERLRRCRPSP